MHGLSLASGMFWDGLKELLNPEASYLTLEWPDPGETPLRTDTRGPEASNGQAHPGAEQGPKDL